jgi:dihydroflavonol-4-reductase
MSGRSDRVVLVTGASGFVGGAVVRHLLEKGKPVRCLVRDRRKAEDLAWLRPPVQLHVGDITDPGTLPGAMDGAGIVFNCAGLNSFWEPDRRAFDRINVEGTRNVMLAALEARVRKVVHVSTVMAYGFPDRMPFAADCSPGPHMSDYARSKHKGDEAAWEVSRSRGLPLVVVHLAAVVGRGDPKSVMQIRDFVRGRVPVMIRSANRFTYVDIDDAAEAIIAAGLKAGNEGARYLVGGHRLTTMDYFALISELSGVPLPRLSIGRVAAMTLARLLTAWAAVVRRPPLLPLDLMRTQFRGSLLFDGDSAAAALGISYTPIRRPLADAVEDARRTRMTMPGIP